MDDDSSKLFQELRKVGFSSDAIEAAWPSWWSDDISASPSSRAELRFALARKLGLSAKPLLGERVEATPSAETVRTYRCRTNLRRCELHRETGQVDDMLVVEWDIRASKTDNLFSPSPQGTACCRARLFELVGSTRSHATPSHSFLH